MSEQRSWDDPTWIEKGDNAWQRRLRRHQGWWRETQLKLEPGPMVGGSRLVVSMLPEGVAISANIWTDEARQSVIRAEDALSGRPGKIERTRLERNLLSSQPVCFNLFGYLSAYPQALLPWTRTVSPNATAVINVELEWATLETAVGGSAFDAFVEYETGDGRGFLGIECKYAEDLAAAQRQPAPEKYKRETTPPLWRDGAIAELDRNGRRQFWYNTLLAQRLQRAHGYVESRSVVAALEADMTAKAATADVASQLSDPRYLVFSSIEDIVGSVEGHDSWRETFRERYLDLQSSDGHS